MVHVVVIDDHDLVRSTLRKTIDRYRDIEVAGDADSGEAGLEVVALTEPDVVIIDSDMPGIGGAETTKRLLASMPNIQVIGHSGDASNEQVLLDAGAVAFVVRGSPVGDLVNAILRVGGMERTGEPR